MFYLGNVSGSGPMSAIRVVLFGDEIVHKVVHFREESFGARALTIPAPLYLYSVVNCRNAVYAHTPSRDLPRRIAIPLDTRSGRNN